MNVEGVDFVSIPTRDIERSLRFYTETLGLMRSPAVHAEIETGTVTLSLWEPAADGLPFQPNTAGFALRVPDVAEARRALEADGVDFLGDTVDTGVCHMAFLRDPDGNVVILHRRYAPR